MIIAVVTRDRGPERQLTTNALRGVSFLVKTFCHPDDLVKWPNFAATPVPHDWVYEIRQAVLDDAATSFDGKILMLDDDFNNWGSRQSDGRYTKASVDQLESAFKEVEQYLDKYPIVGIGQRFMANNRPEVVINGRVNGAIGINTKMLSAHGIKFRRKTMEDFDLLLQCLTNGLEIMNYSRIVYEQAGSNTKGGCSTYRSLELHNQGAEELAATFPGLVRVVDKTTSGSWGGGTRKDVVVSWKKAFKCK